MRLLPTHKRCRILDLIDELQPQVIVNTGLLHRARILLPQLALCELLIVLILHFRKRLFLVLRGLLLEVRLQLLQLLLLSLRKFFLLSDRVLSIFLHLLELQVPPLFKGAHVVLD